MAEENEEDAFASMIRFCQPTTSQEAKFPSCRMSLEFQNEPDPDLDPYPDVLSSSSGPTYSEPTAVVMVSPPGSASSSQQQAEEDDVVFHTPPEHYHHSSEEQNLDELCARAPRNCEVGDGCRRSKKARVSEGELDADDAESEKIRVQSEVFDAETVTVGETEEIVIETQVDKEVIVVDSGEKMVGINDLGQKNCEMMRDGVPATTVEEPSENRYSTGNFNSSKIEEEIVKLKRIADNGCSEMTHEKSVENENTSEDVCRNGGLKRNFDGCSRRRRPLDDEAESEEIRVRSEVFDSETVPVGETGEIVIETQADKAVILVNSGEKMVGVNDLGQKSCEMMRDGVPANTTIVEDSSKIEEEIAKLERIADDGCSEMTHLKSIENENTSEDVCRNGGLKRNFDGCSRRRRQLDDEAESEKIRVQSEIFDSETVPVGETEGIAIETQADKEEQIAKLERIADDGCSEMTHEKSVEHENTSEDVRRNGGLKRNFDGCSRRRRQLDDEAESEKIRVQSEIFDSETVPVGETEGIAIETQADKEVILVDSGEKMVGMNDLGQKSWEMMRDGVPANTTTTVEDSSKIEEGIVKLERIAGNGCSKMTHEQCVKIAIDENSSEDVCRNRGLERNFHGCSKRGRQLQISLNGKEKNVEEERNTSEKMKSKGGLLDFLDILKVVVGAMDDDGEEVDFLETAKRRGMTFSRPRWWAPECRISRSNK